MNILYIHQYFVTPDAPGLTSPYWKAQKLIKSGHQVTVLRWSSEIMVNRERGEYEGIKLITLKTKYNNAMGVTKRFRAFIKFMLQSSWFCLKEKPFDLLIASSTPLTVGFPALVLKKTKKVPYVFEVMDLWPEVPIQMGGLKNKYVIRVARWFEKKIYDNASHIIAASPGMKRGVIKSGIEEEQVSTIPNMSKIDIFWSRKPNLTIAEEEGISISKFNIIYFGALGRANAIDYILDTARLLVPNKDIQFLFVGHGAMLPTILGANFPNVKYVGEFNQERVSEIVNLCDLSIVTFGNLPILRTNSPSKLFDSLSAGLPIIVNSAGWTKDLVEQNGCGMYVDPESPEDFANKIIFLKNSPDLRKDMGGKSRKLAETKYDKSILCRQFYDIIVRVKSQEGITN